MTEKLKWFAGGFACCLLLVLVIAATAQGPTSDGPQEGTYSTNRFWGWQNDSGGMAILDTQTGDMRYVDFGAAKKKTIRFSETLE